MLKTISALAALFRAVAALAFVALLGYGGWTGYRHFFERDLALRERDSRLRAQAAELKVKSAKISELEEDVAAKRRQIERLETAVRLLKVDRRVAQIVVLEQGPVEDAQAANEAADDSPRPLRTRFNFVEVDDEGRPLEEPREYTIDGDVIYVDAWVAKFADEHVEAGDPLRATSVCLFRRLFGEFQEPNDGFVLDAIGSRPAAYSRGAEMSDLEREIWDNFWQYANDPARAKAAGVRAAHGEAPSVKLQPGKLYRLELRASGGLSIVPEDLPAAITNRPL